MSKKRGQITIFVVLGILIVAAIALIALYTQGLILPLSEEESKQVLGSQIEPVRLFASKCVEEVSSKALTELGINAGYANYELEGLKSIDFSGEKVVIAQNTAQGFVNRLPSLSEVENQFLEYMEEKGYDEVDECVNDFKEFEDLGINVNSKNKRIEAEILDESVNLNVNWEVEVRRNRARIPVEVSNSRILMDFGKSLNLANDIVNKEVSGVEFQGLEYDKYVSNHPFTLKEVELESQNYPTKDQKIFFISSVKEDPREVDFKFYFAVDRSLA